MSGWPRGAVDSLCCCSADVLTGSGPFAHSLAKKDTGLQRGMQVKQVKQVRRRGEIDKGEHRKLAKNMIKWNCRKNKKGDVRNYRKKVEQIVFEQSKVHWGNHGSSSSVK